MPKAKFTVVSHNEKTDVFTVNLIHEEFGDVELKVPISAHLMPCFTRQYRDPEMLIGNTYEYEMPAL